MCGMNEINGIVSRKLALLDDQVSNLQSHLEGVSREKFIESWLLRSMTERALQVAVEIVIDVSERILSLKGSGPVATAVDSVKRLRELKIIKSEAPYLDMVRFRNLIVHQYERVEPGMLYDIATGRLDDFKRFRDEIYSCVITISNAAASI